MTHDNGMDAQDNAWAQLGRHLAQKERTIRELKDERDRVVAKFETFARASMSVVDAENTHARKDAVKEWQFALAEQPAIALERLKAKWQAEALEDMASEFRGRMKNPDLLCLIDAEYLEKMARHLRRAAKGLEGGDS